MKIIFRTRGNLLIIFLLFIYTFVYTSCNKEPDLIQDYFLIYTEPATEISLDGVCFNGKIVERGNEDIIEYGFIWGYNESINIQNSNKIMIGSNLSDSDFSVKFDYKLLPAYTYYYKAYVKTSEYIFYGNPQKYKSPVDHWEIMTVLPDYDTSYSVCGGFGHVYDNKFYIGVTSSLYDSYDNPVTSNSKRTVFYEYDFINLSWTEINNEFKFDDIDFSFIENDKIYYTSKSWLINYSILWFTWKYANFYNLTLGHKFLYNGKIYIMIPGQNLITVSGDINIIEKQSQFNLLESKSIVPDDMYTNGVQLNGFIYVVGSQNQLWKYDPLNDLWEVETYIPSSINVTKNFKFFNFDNQLYFIQNNRLFRYKHLTSKWEKSNYLTPNLKNSCVTCEMYLNILMNSDEVIFQYDPSKDSFTEISN